MTDGRSEKVPYLEAMAAALADPVRLVRVLQEATDDEDAVRRVAEAFGLARDQAAAVLDQQLRLVTPAHRQRVADELRVLRAVWGPPVEAELRFATRRSAVLVLDGTERRLTGGSRDAVLDLVFRHLLEEVALPRLRPVVAAVSGASGELVRMTVTPARDAHYEYAQ